MLINALDLGYISLLQKTVECLEAEGSVWWIVLWRQKLYLIFFNTFGHTMALIEEELKNVCWINIVSPYFLPVIYNVIN